MVPALVSYASTCPSTNVIAEPPQFQWTLHPASGSNPEPYYSGVMEIGEATFTIGGETLTTRAYRKSLADGIASGIASYLHSR